VGGAFEEEVVSVHLREVSTCVHFGELTVCTCVCVHFIKASVSVHFSEGFQLESVYRGQSVSIL